MLACDLAVAADDARFTLAYARIGATPDGSATYWLPRTVGPRKAKEIALLADTLPVEEAHRLGLVSRIVPRAALDEEAGALARRLAAGPTRAYGRIKELIHGSLAADLPEQLLAEERAFLASTRTADFAEGVSSFLAKCPPTFRGA
jgi:2-(1,2-epoxy-1,2-dihydrophenyl)acetyl-CoA isomerase